MIQYFDLFAIQRRDGQHSVVSPEGLRACHADFRKCLTTLVGECQRCDADLADVSQHVRNLLGGLSELKPKMAWSIDEISPPSRHSW